MRARCDNNSASEVSQQSAEIKGEGRKKHLANLSNASYSQLAVHIKADFESDDWILWLASRGIKAEETHSQIVSMRLEESILLNKKKGWD